MSQDDSRRPGDADEGAEGIAVIGMSGRFPGASTIEEYWHNLREGVESISFFSREELEAAGIPRDLLDDPIYVPASGALQGIDRFDAAFFDYSPREAELMDPQYRLILECSWEALEKAGYETEAYGGSIGVFAGMGMTQYLIHNLLSHPNLLARVGRLQVRLVNDKDFLASSVAFRLNLTGPSISVQTACSTSLVAICLASQSLLQFQCDMALAGGVSVAVPQPTGYPAIDGVLSPDGHCRAFDARSRGTVEGSGAGIVVLKRLSDALADGDTVHAVIKGFATNNDGAYKMGFTAPSVDGQMEVIAMAQAVAGVSPETITYVEAHGTGTPMGDPIEVTALTEVFAAGTGKKQFCALGSVKTNLGHLDSAAGIASFIKTVLALEQGVIPPSLHFERPNPEIDFEDSPFFVNTRALPWRPDGMPRRAGVSAFALGGVNAHIVLEEAPAAEPTDAARPWQLLTLSARTATALETATENLARFLEERPELSPEDLADAAYTLQVGRRSMAHRRAVVVRDVQDAMSALRGGDPRRLLGGTDDRRGARELKTAFLFPGLGNHHVGMARGLYRTEPGFRERVDDCAERLLPLLGVDLRQVIWPEGDEEEAAAGSGIDLRGMLGRGPQEERSTDADRRLARTALSQPAVFVVEYALAGLWMDWGIAPQAMVGFSVGEYVAACLAGVLSLDDALRLVAGRARLIDELPAGAMLAVPLSEADAGRLAGPELSVAAVCGPGLTVLAGSEAAVAAVEERLTRDGHVCRRLQTTHAFHSAMMEPVLGRFLELFRGIALREPEIPFLSNVTGTWITPEQATSPAYWAEHLRQTVRFADAVEELWREPGRVLLEAGPGQTLSAWALQHPAAPAGALAVPSLRHSFDRQDDRAFLLGSLARLWLAGMRIDWPLTWSGERRRRVPLPTYPFERQRYWIEAARNAPAPAGFGVDPGPIAAGGLAAVEGPGTSPRGALPGGMGGAGGMHPRPDLPVPFTAPRGAAEERVSEILREILHLDRVGVHDGFFDLGGDSLLATRLVARLNQSFGAELSLRSVFEMPTAAQLASAVGDVRTPAPDGRRIGRRRAVDTVPPLSYSQQRLWVLDQLEPGSPFYNVPGVSELLGPVDPAVLARCFAEIVRRHEALRTTFAARDGRPYQVIAPPPGPAEPWPLPLLDLSALPAGGRTEEVERQAVEEAQRPFDLTRGPLVRTLLLRRGPEDHVLLLTIHHIVSDGWSLGVVTRELAALYEAFAAGRPSPLPELPVQYADFAEWQAGWLQGEVLERETAYWRERLAGSPPFLDLPTDRPRPPLQGYRGARLPLAFPPALTEALMRRGREAGTTLFMAVLAGFGALLSRTAGQTDVLIGSPVANRNHPDLEGLIGFFVNTLVMRLDLGGDPAFGAVLERARETVQSALAHQDLPFEKLVEELQPRRDLSRSPLFQVMLVLQRNPEMAGVEMGAGRVRRLEMEPGVSRFDLLIDLEEREGTLLGGLEINTDLFDRSTGQRLAGHLLVLLEAAAAEPAVRLSELPLLREAERQQLLREWEGTADPARPALLHEWVEGQAARTPGAVAVEGDGTSFTYEELNRRADQLAQTLTGLGVGPEVRVALRAERSPETAVSVLGVLKAGGVCVPLDPSYPAQRLAFMRGEAEAVIELGGEAPSPTLPRFAGEGAPALPAHFELSSGSEGAPAQILRSAQDDKREAVPGGGALSRASARGRVGEGALPPESLAYLLFTSGSTGRPKGVAMSHGALSRLIAWQLRSTPGPLRTLQFAPLSFDVSFQELFATWASGGTLVLVAEETRRDPEALWRHLAERSVERLFLPFVALQQLAEAARGRAERPPLSEVVTAGEALQVTPAVVDLFRRLPGARLHNQYGPTETHVVTAEVLTGAPGIDPATWPLLPPIGRPVDGDRVRVLDPAFQPCPAGVPGELCLGGAGLARGYVRRPDLTAERFVPDPLGAGTEAGGERLYRTGDRARFLADGRLEHLGRLDAQVKIRGFRVEPGEVEAVLAAHPAVAEAAVSVEGEGPARRLAAWVVPRAEAPAPADLRAFLQERLPDFMIPAGFGFLEALPLTPSGKVDRRALPRLEPAAPDGAEGFVPPRTEVEEVLAGLWSEVLGITPVGAFDDFFARGGHSLVATQLVSRIRTVLGVDLGLRAIFEAPTVAGLAGRVEAQRRLGAARAPALPARPTAAGRRSPLLPLSFAQERLWFLDRLDPESAAYNIPSATAITGAAGSLRPAALEAALAEVVRRHEALRTRFEEIEGVPWQRVLPEVEVRLPLIDLSALPEAVREREAGRLAEAGTKYRFDLGGAPLFAVWLVRLGEGLHHLLAVLHHIIADGWSSAVLIHELSVLYEAALLGRPSPLPPLPLQYADFAVQQRAALAGEALDRLLAGWRTLLAGAPESLPLPTDRPHPPVQSYRGHSLPVRLEGLAAALGGLARKEGATLFMALLGAFQALLCRYSGQEDVVVGSPVAGRNRRELESLIGCFINTLPLRTDLSGDPTFRELLGRVREGALESYGLQELPFEKLVGELHPVRDLARPPLFQTFLILQNTPPAVLELPGLTLTPLPLEGQGAKFELLLSLTEERGGLDGYLEHSADLFDRTTAARIARRFATLAAAAARDPDVRLSQLAWLPESERRQILAEWNDTAVPAEGFDGLLHRLFEDQARRTPDAVALAGSGARLTYAGLEERSARLAARLRQLGAGPEVRVGVCLERTPDLVVAILAVLRAGAAYVPMDPAHPAERRAFLVRDARIPVILATPETAAGLPLEGARIVDPRREGGPVPAGPLDGGAVLPSNLAYLIYTSGSTGQPKGVAITHRNAAALLRWAEGLFSSEEISGLLASTSVGFDLSVFELFVPLTRGGRVILAENALQLPSLPEAGEVTLLNTVPSVLAELLRSGGLPPSVTTVNLAGEPLRGALVEELARAGNVRKIYNLYGPSEDTTYSTGARIVPGGEREPSIGRPIAGTQAHVLDARLELLGIGVPGELGLAGAGLARGYLGRPGLTAERFVPDPTGGEPGGRLYRTGDLARLRPDGEIEFLGRLDHQVKVRGVRIELGEIEAVLALHPGVAQAAVLAVLDDAGERRLVAHVARRGGDASATATLRAWLQGKLPAAMVPSSFRFHPALPLTPNGKVDRRALARPSGSGSRAEPRPEELEAERRDPTPLEAWVLGTFTSVLGLEGRKDGDRVRLHDNFFDLGGHSLMATRILSRVRSSLGIDLPLRAVFENPTPARLAAVLEAAGRAAMSAAGAAAAAAAAGGTGAGRGASGRPLSFAQHRLWFVDQLEPGSPLYNIATALRVTGPLRADVLGRCLAEVRRRHEVLRTTFAAPAEGEEAPVQIVHTAPASFGLPVIDLSGLPEALREREALGLEGLAAEEAMRPFDLARGPLWRATVLRLAPTDALFLLTLHHIVSDGWSMGILIREVGELYEAFSRGLPSPLPALPLQYADHAERQVQSLAGEVLERDLSYWRQQLAGLPPVLELPADRPRSGVSGARSFHGGVRATRISAGTADGLRSLARQGGTTLFVALLAGFQALLGRYTGQRDLAVGTPVAGRGQLDTEGLIGLFINTLVLRADLSGDPGFRGLLGRAREVTLAAQAHPEVPFERLVEELAPERSLHHTPLFQVMLLLQNLPQDERRVGGLTLRPLHLELAGAIGQTAKFDLTLILEERDGGLLGAFKYNADLFDAPTVDRLTGHLETFLAGAVADPDGRLSELPLLTPPEARQVVGEWNDTAAPYPAGRCLHELIAEQALRTPEAVAVVLESETLTYGELSGRAGELAAHLRGLGVGPEVPVAICAERSLELVVGLLGILEAGGAYLPLDPEYPRERLAFLLADSGAPVLLVQEGLRERLPATAARTVLLGQPPIRHPERSEGSGGGTVRAPSPDNLAYVIYTSGSTGTPKGVAVPHRGAVNRLLWAQRAYPVTPADRVLQIASFSFDFSVWELFAPLLAGGTLVLAVPGGHRDAAYLVRAIQEQEVTVVHFVPSMLQLFLEEPGVERCASLRHVLSGGEALTRELESRYFSRFTRRGTTLWNQYGPTEVSIDATARICRPGEGPERPVPIGRPIANSTTYVLDRGLQPVPAGVLGELFLGGDGVARGYLGRPALTAERFVPDPWGAPGSRLYRTGDRSRWRPDGEVEFLGRLDHQVKVRGVRIELGEVEALLLQHPAVRDAAVVVEDAQGDQRIAAFVVESEGRLGFGDSAAQELALADLRSFVRERLPAYMVPAVWTVLESLPLTPAGKVDRRALARRVAEEGPAAAAFAPPRTATETQVAGVWSELLKRERIGAHDDFFALGGHSLLATRVVSRLRALFQVELPLRALFEASTVEGLAARVEQERAARGLEESAPPILPVPRDPAGMPLSFAQERLWFIDQLEPGSPLYNIPVALRVTGPLDAAVLARSLGEIERRHEVLRTVFPAADGPPLQKALPAGEDAPFPLAVEDLSHLADPERAALARVAEESARPFDLGHGPVWRAFLWKLRDGEHLALLTLHHIASDGWSMGLLVREVAAFYGATPLPPLPIQYADYAVWQRRWLQGEVLARELAYWRERLDGAPAVLELPADRARPPIQSYRGAFRPVRVPRPVSERLLAFSRERGATPFMVLLAAFQALLGRLSGQSDLTVGSPVAGRNRVEVENLVGFFVNTLVLRGDLSGDPSFRTLAERAREEALGAQAHQEVPFEKLVEELAPERSLGHAPLFQAMLSLQNTPREPLVLPGLTLSPLDAPETLVPVAKLDLTLTLAEVDGAFAGSLEYATDLFDEATAERFAGCFLRLLEGALEDPEARVSGLPLLAPEELRQLAFLDGGAAPAEPRRAHELFEEWADRAPEALAVELDGERWTYGELEARANRLARRLLGLGVRPEAVVAVGLERSLDAVAALLAVWKAGGVYLPLDPAYPEARRAWLLADSGARVLVGKRPLLGGLAAPSVLRLDEEDLASESPAWPAAQAAPGNLAYLIYTSGSTGEPKAVAVEHAPAAAHFTGVARAYGLGPADRMLLFAALSFDVSVEQIGTALSAGAALVMRGDELWSPSELSGRLLRHGVTVANLPTAYWAQWARELAAPEASESPAISGVAGIPLRWAVPGGEALTPEAARLWLETPATAGVPLLNAYGPTEAVMTATHFPVRPGGFALSSAAVPIGRPLAHRRAYVLDRLGHPQPLGVPGELCLGGLLARGYLGRPALTAERFVPDPFAAFHGEAGARLYRTGDLARRPPSGELEFLGRVDHQVKVRGFRVELGEIEAVLARHPQVLESAVLLLESGSGAADARRLVAYVASRVPPAEVTELAATLREHLAGALPAPLVPSAFVVLPALPLTPTGKIDRRALPAPGPAEGVSTPGYTAPRNPFEEVLATLWSEVLGVEPVGIHDNFFDLGGHSLLATQLASRLRRAFRVEMPLRDLFEAPTVAALAVRVERLIRAGEGPSAPPIRPLPPEARESGLPLSFAQQRLWLVDHLEPGNTAYNIPFAVRLDGTLRPDLLERTFSEIQRRHETLRTRFALRAGEPIQLILPPAPMPLPRIDLDALPEALRWTEARRLAFEQGNRPFDLAAGPLFRASLIRLEPDVHALSSAMHHIVSDEWSARLMFQEVVALYGALGEGRLPSEVSLPELPVQYADYAVWQRQWLSGDVLEKQLVYWRARLGGDLPVLELPTDRPRPAVQTYRGHRLRFPLAGPADRAVRSLARREGASLFMTLLAAFYTLLRHLTGQTDLCVGTPITGRTRVEVENLIGFFLNTLVLRADLAGGPGEPTFRDLLRQVRELSLQAYAHQDVPFEKLVDELKPKRTLSHSPLFQALFVLLQTEVPVSESFGLQLSPFSPGLASAKFDLTLSIMAEGEQAWALLEYNTDLFDGTTALRWAGHFESLVAAVAADPDRPLTELPLLSAAEAHQLARELDDRPALPGQDVPVHERFRMQAALTPGRPAVVWDGGGWSYAELDGRAARLAAVLCRRGVGPDERVGVCAERGPELAAALLAVLKAGGAYVPLDPAYPRERLAYMLADAGVKVLMIQEAFLPLLPAPESSLLVLDGPEGVWAPGWEGQEASPAQLDLGHLCYLIYTSGSTGRPKGTALPHSTLANLIGWQLSAASGVRDGEAAPRTLQFVSPSFDVSLQEVFATWCAGGTLVLASDDVRRDPERLIRFLAEERIERLFLPNVALQQLAEQAAGPVPPAAAPALPSSLREIVTAGERLQITPQIAALCEGIPGFRERGALRNQYGPSESHVVTEYVLTGSPSGWPPLPPIGRPIPGTAAHVLDRSLRPVPPGVAGELALGGVCLARGYLNRPDLTAERFLPDGFSGRAGERVYRTGDLVRRLPSGDIEFLGRIDHQVKVRGFRIEPGEIEVVLASHPRVQESAVVVREDGSGDRRLIAYVVAEGGAGLDPVELRDFLRERLPAYMVPAAFLSLPALPLTSSGKVDRAALPAPEGTAGSGVDYVEPKSGLERTIAAAIGEVLGVARVGIEDNFFDLGVHSLLMVRAANGLSERLGRKVQVLEMFRFPTVAALAQHLSQEEDEAPSKEQFEQRAEARRQGGRRRDRRGRAAVAVGTAEDSED